MLLYDVLKKSNKGFTLIEMITTVIVIGVIASIAAPNLLGMLNQTRVKDGLGQVEGAIREAQKLAVRRGKPCTIVFSTNANGNSTVKSKSGFDGCLLSNRELADSVAFSRLNSGTGNLDLINNLNEIELSFSGKGNPTVERIMVVYHPQTNTQKCIQIKGLLGSILTGNYNSTTKRCEAQ